MHTRHANRRYNLQADRRTVDSPPEIDGIEVPVVKIGRYVNFDGPGRQFSRYIADLEVHEDNQRGLSRGWFSLVDTPLFVEYADLTPSLEEVLKSRARPRTFNREANTVIGNLKASVAYAAGEHADWVADINSRRKQALNEAIEADDHADGIRETPWPYEDKASRWGVSLFSLAKQPKPRSVQGAAAEGIYEYGLPLLQDTEDQFVRSDLIEIIKKQGLAVPLPLTVGERPKVPVYSLHRELSGMKGCEPVFPIAPQVQLGPIGIHRF